MALTKELVGFRFVKIKRDDTLQIIADRELGDASRWIDLIPINDLTPPYLTGDPAQVGPKVKLYGDTLLIPALDSQAATASDPIRVFGTDILLHQGLLQADDNGDLAIVSGVANLKQALENAIATPLGDLLFHKTYGCGVHALKGRAGQPATATLGAQYVKSTMLADDRVDSVTSAKAAISGDVTSIEATVVPKTGTSVDILTTV